MEKNKNSKEKTSLVTKGLNVSKLNTLLNVGNKILKILYILLIFLLVYIGIILLKEFKILSIIFKILSVITFESPKELSSR